MLKIVNCTPCIETTYKVDVLSDVELGGGLLSLLGPILGVATVSPTNWPSIGM